MATEIKGIKSGKAAGEDKIRPEMLKALTVEAILWLTRVCQVAWKFGITTRDLQTGVNIPIFKKENRKQYTNYGGISRFSLPGKVYAKCLERKCREIVELKLADRQCGFSSGSQHHGPDLHPEANLREMSGVWQRPLSMLCQS